MKDNQLKKAIDEMISNKPLLNDAFVKRVMVPKKILNKVSWVHPIIVLSLVFFIGMILYFMPNEQRQATTIENNELPAKYEAIVRHYFEAISLKNAQAFAKVSDEDAKEIFHQYSNYKLNEPLTILKTIEYEDSYTVFVLLPKGEGHYFINQLNLVKNSRKITLSNDNKFTEYRNIHLPISIPLQYRPAPFAVQLENFDLGKYQKAFETQTYEDGVKLYQLKTTKGTWRIIETMEGDLFEFPIVSSGQSYATGIAKNEYYIVDEKSSKVEILYKNREGQFQHLSGSTDRQGMINNQLGFHENPFFIWGGQDPTIATIRDGILVNAPILESANLIGPVEFYNVEAEGDMILLKYSEDDFQKSQYYRFQQFDKLEVVLYDKPLEAKVSHLNMLFLIGRGFNRLEFYNDELRVVLRPDIDPSPYAKNKNKNHLEAIDATYKNIKVTVKDSTYYITGDDGFEMTLTRIAERVFIDDKGNEFTTGMYLSE